MLKQSGKEFIISRKCTRMKGRKNEYIMKEMLTTILYQEKHSSYMTRNGVTEKKKKNEMHLIPQNWMLACLKVSAHNHKKRCSDEHGNRKDQERNDKSGSC